MRLLVVLLAFAIGVSPCVSASGQFLDVAHELAESDRYSRLAALGQFNCVEDAVGARPTPACPWVPTKGSSPTDPAMGIRVLESHYATHVGAPTPSHLAANAGETAEDADDAAGEGRAPTAPATSSSGNNLRHDSGGALPDVILPGPGQFRAWYGHWNDKDGDGVIDAWRGTGAAAQAEDEWVAKILGNVAAYVEPGSHPHARNFDRPGESSPDFWYAPYFPTGYEWYQTGYNNDNFILFLDGSLLRSFLVRSVTEPTLSPNQDGTAPFTTTATSLVDVDEYAAAAPGSLADLYASVAGPAVASLGSPSLGSCPNGCRPGPFSPKGTILEPLGPELAPFVKEIYAPYPREHAPGEGSTSAGRHAEHVEAYRGWIDLIPMWGYRNVSGQEAAYYVRAGPLPGKTADGRQAMMPGFLSFEVRTGIWKDLDGDGYIGTGGSDPYQDGFRPHPDDYLDPKGEYFGIFADKGSYATVVSFRITLVPAETWGPGVVVFDDFVGSSGGEDLACLPRPAASCVKDPTRYGAYAGDDPFVLHARRDVTTAAVGGDTVPGLYRSNAAFFPVGSQGLAFTACTDALVVTYTFDGTAVAETLRDCDWIGPLALPGGADAGATR